MCGPLNRSCPALTVAAAMMLVWGYEDGGSEGVMVGRAGRTFSLGHLEVAQVQGLLAGYAPVVGLLAHFVVLQNRLVVHGQPLDRVCGQRLEAHGTECSQKIQVTAFSAAFTFWSDTNCVCVLHLSSLATRRKCAVSVSEHFSTDGILSLWPLQYWFNHSLEVSAHLCKHLNQCLHRRRGELLTFVHVYLFFFYCSIYHYYYTLCQDDSKVQWSVLSLHSKEVLPRASKVNWELWMGCGVRVTVSAVFFYAALW